MPAARVPIARARLRDRGLLRQASRNRMLVLASALHEALDKIEPHHLELEGRGGREFGVDGHQEIAAVDLQAVAGEVEHAGVGA